MARKCTVALHKPVSSKVSEQERCLRQTSQETMKKSNITPRTIGLYVNTPRGVAAITVCVSVCALKEKRLELSTANLVHVQCMSVARQASTLRSEGQRSRSRGVAIYTPIRLVSCCSFFARSPGGSTVMFRHYQLARERQCGAERAIR